jgi:predicted nucleotidyltransferase
MSTSDVRHENDSNTVRQALRELERGLRELYAEKTPLILVYGSQARQEADSASDIDVLLVYPGEIRPGQEINRLRDILAEINLRYQELISVIPVSEKDYKQRTSPFWVNVRKEGIPIDGI